MKLVPISLPEPWRSLPLVTLGLAVVWVLSAATVELGFAGRLREADDRLLTAARFALQHPEVAIEPRILPVARSLMPGFESNEMFDFLRRRGAEAGGTQDQFDGLAASALASADAHPYRALGVVPASPRPHAFVTHVFVHAGGVHVLVNLLLLLLAAPLLERLWGRRVFSTALLAWGVLGAGAYVAVRAGSELALVGGSALVAGCVVAVAVRFRREEVDFLGWLAPVVGAELVVPAFAILPLWILGEALVGWSLPGTLTGLDTAVGWVAHAGAAALGAAVALGAQRLGWEERFGSGAGGLVRSREPAAFELDAVKALRAKGDREAALAALSGQVARRPGHRDAVMLWFVWAVEDEAAEQAAPAVVALLAHELRRGAEDVALAQWAELVEHVPDAALPADTGLRLASASQRSGAEETLLVLLQAVIGSDASGEQLATAARLAAEVSPELALEAARAALCDEALAAGRRRELEALVARFAPEGADDVPGDRERKPAQKPAPSVFYEQSDRSAFGDVGDLSALDDFPRGVLVESRPLALHESGLKVEAAERGEVDVPFARVRGVSMAGVHGLGPKPVVLVDLLLDGGGMERPLSVLRLRSDGFDPRTLLADGPDQPLDALRAVVARLLSESGGLALPDPEGAAGQPVRVFATLDAYHEGVLQPAAQQLA